MSTEQAELLIAQRTEVVRGLESVASKLVDRWMTPVEDDWQPTDYLVDFSQPNWAEQVLEFQKRAARVPLPLLAVIIGNAVTEATEGSYQTALNRVPAFADQTGVDSTALARWSRWWTGQENRHGEVTSDYLYLTGRVNMRQFQVTIQHLYRNGFDAQTRQDPYLGFVYTSKQERSTRHSWGNSAKAAGEYGETLLQRIEGKIAGEERRHEAFNSEMFGEVFDHDPNGAMIACKQMVDIRVIMPAALMADSSIPIEGRTSELFRQYAALAHLQGIYRASDYARIALHFIRYWDIPNRIVTGEAAKAQDYFEKYEKKNTEDRLHERDEITTKRILEEYPKSIKLSWLHDEPINLAELALAA